MATAWACSATISGWSLKVCRKVAGVQGGRPFLAQGWRFPRHPRFCQTLERFLAQRRPTAQIAAPRTSSSAWRFLDRHVQQIRIAAVADGDQHVAHEAVAPDALDGRARKQRAEAGIVERGELGQARRRADRRAASAPSRACFGELVPRADRQAIVAAIDAVADQRPQRRIDRALVLDGEIGDAAPRIETVGRGKAGSGRCRGRPALAAMVGLGRVGRASPARRRSRPGTARSRAGATPGWCACPASRWPAAAPAAFPSPARCRRRP